MKAYFIILAGVIGLTACSKHNSGIDLPSDNGCIEVFQLPRVHSINSSDIGTVNNLLTSNGINITNLRYYRYIHDTFQTLYPPFTRYDQKLVRAEQYTNGLRIFTGDVVWMFFNDTLHIHGGLVTNGTNLNTSPGLQLGQLRKLFIDHIEKFEHKGNQYKDSCFRAEFGYFNINPGTTNTQEVLVKAWKVTPKVNDYPVAFYHDADGQLEYYDNGIRTFR